MTDMVESTKRDKAASPIYGSERRPRGSAIVPTGGTSSRMSHFSRSAWQQRKEHRRLACEIHSRGNLIDHHPRPSLRASVRQRASFAKVGMARRAASLHCSHGTLLPCSGRLRNHTQPTPNRVRRLQRRLHLNLGSARRAAPTIFFTTGPAAPRPPAPFPSKMPFM